MGGSSSDISEIRASGNQMSLQQRPPSRPSLNIPHRPSPQDKKSSTKHYESLIPNIPINESHKLTEFLRTNLDNIEGLSSLGLANLPGLGNSNKDLLALHNGAWSIENDKHSRSSSANSEGDYF